MTEYDKKPVGLFGSMLTDEESDANFGRVPELPEGLEERTLKAMEAAINIDISRMEDVASIRFRKAVARLTGKPYNPPAGSLAYRFGTWFYRTFK